MVHTTLLLVRHAQTSSNGHAPTLSGWTDVPLTKLGDRQVRALACKFADERLDAVVSSPLERAHATAIALAHGRPLEVCPDLREIYCGRLEGVPVPEIIARYPELWNSNLRQDDDDFRWPEGESYREFRARCLGAVERWTQRFCGGRVAMVTHTGVITQVLGTLTGARPARWDAFRVGNASVTEVVWGDGEGRIVHFDERNHLEQSGVPAS